MSTECCLVFLVKTSIETLFIRLSISSLELALRGEESHVFHGHTERAAKAHTHWHTKLVLHTHLVRIPHNSWHSSKLRHHKLCLVHTHRHLLLLIVMINCIPLSVLYKHYSNFRGFKSYIHLNLLNSIINIL